MSPARTSKARRGDAPAPHSRPPRSIGPRRKAKSGRRTARSGAASRTKSTVLIAAALLLLSAGLFWATIPEVGSLSHQFPQSTALIDARTSEAKAHGRAARRAWHPVPLSHIARTLQEAVVDSEDARFFLHHGVDVVETRAALEKAADDGKLGRGASTLTQQLAKNLWLGEQRSLWRKAREAAMAWRLESLGKERILELYLNLVEWGDGIYGADAAAQHWFGVRASELQPEQAAILAAMLPAPRKRNPKRPSAHLKQRAEQVLELFGVYKQLKPDELAAARARLHALLGG